MTTDPLWYKDAIIYQLHVKAFYDSNGDGIGDFKGLAAKLDYLQELGVTAIWLLPFYPSPLRDDGYDISDYRRINPRYGAMRDFRAFLREARRRDLRVITELVVNHTSDQHPWFQKARNAKPGSAARNFYVWSDDDRKYGDTRIIFTDTETSNWAWDPVAKSYYWHRFFSHQPDLNFDNPRVVEAMIDTMRYWLDMGVDGLRLDAIPYLCEREGTNCENLPETHQVVRRLRTALDEHYDDKAFLAEANQWPEDVRPYFGDGDECHIAFHFPLMPRIYMAVAQEDRHPITDIMRQTPDIPDTCQWAIFLRNHDELTLEMVTDRERDYLWQFYAQDRQARINVGIRRRLAPLLDNDRRKIELLNGLLMSMPGTPIVYYGDEIGMGDNIFLGDRDGVRTPMQWTPDRNGGFSTADPARLYLPAIMDPVYGFGARNVEAQARDPSSLLNWMKRLIGVRRQHASFGRGGIRFLYPGNRKVLAYLREYEGETILVIANLSRSPQPVELNLSEFKGHVPVELLGSSPFPPIGELPYFITLASYGFYWFLLAEEARAPSWHEPYVAPLPELLTLVTRQGWENLTSGPARETLEQRILPEFLGNQRWFAAKERSIAGIRQIDRATRAAREGGWSAAIYEVTFGDGGAQLYSVPQSIDWEDRGDEVQRALLPWTLGRVRRGPQIGLLYDATADAAFARDVIRAMAEEDAIETEEGGELRFSATPAFGAVKGFDDPASLSIRRMGAEQSNTSILIEEKASLKMYRRLEPGIHPELEIGRHLTEVAGFRNAPALLGAAEHVAANGQRTAIAILQQFVANQGDGWKHAINYLDRCLDEAIIGAEEAKPAENIHAGFTLLIEVLGRRVAELHRAFAVETDDADFMPEPIRQADLDRWKGQISMQIDRALDDLATMRADLSEGARASTERLLDLSDALRSRIDALWPEKLDTVKTRYHGDLHLGQILIAEDDVYILDFEGEPARPLEERRAKHHPLRDVAGMRRSFDYAAWTGAQEGARGRPDMSDALLDWTRGWRQAVDTAFAAGYRAAIGDCPSYPADEKTAQQLIEIFMIEKACYEIRYEAANRPSWLQVPINGVLGLIAGEEEGRP